MSAQPTWIVYTDGWKYRLERPYSVVVDIRPARLVGNGWVTLDPSGVLTISDGYCWDGATHAPDWDCAKRPSAVHDALYQLIGLGMISRDYRPYADQLFRAMCAEDGMTGKMAALWHKAVSWFGPKGGSRPKPLKFAPRGDRA